MKHTLWLVLLFAAPSHAQVVTTFWGFNAQSPDGIASISAAGDIDGDGVGDLFAADPRFGGPAGANSGRVWALSGADGSVIRIYDAADAESDMGWVLADGHDITGDGIPELLAGSPTAEALSGALFAGRIYVFDGASGAVLYSISGTVVGEQLGTAADFVDDRDGDGIDDFIVTAVSFPCTASSSVTVCSAATGLPISSQTLNSGAFGSDVAGIGDTDGDGLGDILVSGFGDSGFCSSQAPGGHVVFEGLWTSTAGVQQGPGTSPSTRRVAELGDVDGDGVLDYGVSCTEAGFGGPSSGRVTVYSGTGGVIHRIDGVNGEELGGSLAAVGDVDGDGFADFAVSALPGILKVFSGSSAGLYSNLAAVPSPASGVVESAKIGDVDGNGRSEFAYIEGGVVFARGDFLITPSNGLTVISGAVQSARINDLIFPPIVAELQSLGTGAPIVGAQVSASWLGIVVGQPSIPLSGNTSAVTNTIGRVQFLLDTPSRPGPAQLKLDAGGAYNVVLPVQLSEDRVVSLVSGGGQVVAPNQPLTPVVVQVTDMASGLPVANTFVRIKNVGVWTTTTLLPTDANGLVSISATGSNTLGPASLAVTAPGASEITIPVTVATCPLSMTIVSGNGQSTSAGTAFPDPVVLRVEDGSGPVAGVAVTLFTPLGLVVEGSKTLISDTQGRVSFQVRARTRGHGNETAFATMNCGNGLNVTFFVRKLGASTNNSSLSTSLLSDVPAMPILFAADVPIPAPGYTMTPFGRIYTSINAPAPTFLALDGIGLFGPPDPSMVADPVWARQFNVPGSASGLSVVFKVYGLIPGAVFPDNIFISNPVTLTL